MNTDKKTRNFFTIFIAVLFLIFSYYIIKSFFNEEPKNRFSKDGSFSFIYDTKILNSKDFDKMYDDTRTNRVVADVNYRKETDDLDKGKLLLKPSKLYYYFSNTDEQPKNYELTIDNLDYLYLYKLNESLNKISFAIMGTDLKYYTISISLNFNTEDMKLDSKEWVSTGKKLSVFDNVYYKVIDEKVNIQIELPSVLNDEKYQEEDYNELRDTIEKSISVKQIDNFEYNYYSFDTKDISISKNIKLLLKDSKIMQYYSKNDQNNDISYTKIVFINNDKFISLSDIDDSDKYNNYLANNNYKVKEYTYKGIKTYLVYTDDKVSNAGIIYDSFIFDIDDRYYSISVIGNNSPVSDTSLDEWITNSIDGVLEIK